MKNDWTLSFLLQNIISWTEKCESIIKTLKNDCNNDVLSIKANYVLVPAHKKKFWSGDLKKVQSWKQAILGTFITKLEIPLSHQNFFFASRYELMVCFNRQWIFVTIVLDGFYDRLAFFCSNLWYFEVKKLPSLFNHF